MAVLAPNMSGHLHNQLTRSLERILEDANQSGELKLSNRKLKEFPKASSKYNLSDTVIADLSKNRFSELPEEITSFYFLEKLQCYHNAIRHVPDSVSSLQCLSYLDLSRNQLTSLPREICQLPIQILLVSNNKLSCLPDELNKMTQLTELDASCNHLTHLPPRMGELKLMQSLILRSNLLLCVPVEITYLKLVRLDLRANRICALPIEMREMDSLIDLQVDDNPLTSPPASLCKRGSVHIFKYLEIEAIKLDRKAGIVSTGTLGRRSRRSGAGSSPGPPSHIERLKSKRQNVDSGYSTSSDYFDKRWSQDLTDGDNRDKQWNSSPLPQKASTESNGLYSTSSTPSTISPAHDSSNNSNNSNMEDDSRMMLVDCDKKDDLRKEYSNPRLNQFVDSHNITNGNGVEDKSKPLQQIQTYREYKEALKQQRAQDVPAIYRTKDNEDQSYKTEPNTPTHHNSPARTNLSTSRSDPTPLNSALSSPKHIFDDTLNNSNSMKKPVQKVPPSRNCTYSPTNHGLFNGNNGADTTNVKLQSQNGNQNGGVKFIQDYVKPQSPLKASSGILSHDNVPLSPSISLTNGKPNSPRSHNNYLNGGGSPKSVNGTKANRTISWNADVTSSKMTFTMRREIDKAREETDLINQLRTIIESRLKMELPEDLAPALTDGVVLCHLANHIRPRSVASIHVPSPAVPKLTMARCRRNVDNFIDACRKIGVDENLVCCAADVLEGRGLVQVAITVTELVRFHSPKSPLHSVVPTVI